METDLVKLSKRYAERATMLTEGIQKAESMLLDLPGRVRTVTAIGGGESLVWDRHDGEWRILWCFGECETPLASASVQRKANAAKYLSCLYDDIAEAIQEQIDTVDMGLGALQLFFNPVVAEEARQ